MSESMRIMIIALLVPIYWALLSHFAFRPVERLALKYLPPKWGKLLTKQFFPEKPR